MLVSTSLRAYVNCQSVLEDSVIEIQGRQLLTDLILFDMEEFDVILGMDWLSSYNACVECFRKELISRP